MQKMSDLLNSWYLKNQRVLPWRRNRDPYPIWISEIMLQQTTVAAVIPYFEKFLEAFPTVKSLAKASEDEVLALWSGLGYYSRGRNLRKAAQDISALKNFPKTSENLLKLPGIGPYTAAAISSQAFGEPVAAVDGNVIRVVSRLYDIAEDVGQRATRDKINSHAQELLKGQNPSDHNQAVMELGATLCTPKNPSCLLCPLRTHCQAFKAGTVLQRPVKTKVQRQEKWLWKMNVIRNKSGELALVRNGNGSPWLNHLWVLPGEAKAWTKKKEPPFSFRHAITHHKIFVHIAKAPKKSLNTNGEVLWVSENQMSRVGVSSIVTKALKYCESL